MILIVFFTPVFAPDWKPVYYGLVSYITWIGMSFSNKECGLGIILLILFVEFSYSIEHLLQELRFRDYCKVSFRTRFSLEEGLFGRFVVY